MRGRKASALYSLRLLQAGAFHLQAPVYIPMYIGKVGSLR